MFDNGLSIGCCCLIYLAIIITSMVLFSEAYESVNPGKFAILQNKFSKKFDPEVYYSGRYYTGIAKRFIEYPLQYQTLIFSSRRQGADSTPITSTTSSGSSISVACLVQYAIRPEKIHDIYIKWPAIDRLKSDLKASIKQIVSSLINQYTATEFRTKRGEINSRMSYNIGLQMKNNFFCDLNVFTISEVILEDRDLNAFLNAQITIKSSLLQAQTNLVSQVVSQITQLQAQNKIDIATINSDAQSSASSQKLALISAADSAYATTIKTTLDALKTEFTTQFSGGEFSSFMYYLGLIDERKGGLSVFGAD